MDLDQLKARLKELIEASEALNSLSEEEKNERVELMMNASAEDIASYIKVFEEEQAEMEVIHKDLESHADEVEAFMMEEEELKHKEERKQLEQQESKDQAYASKEAANLMQQLEDATEDEVKQDKKSEKLTMGLILSNFFKERLGLKKLVRGTFAAIIGTVLCGLAGVLIVFAIVFAMGKYAELDVVYNLEPLIRFNAYWFALIYGSLIGLILIPVLRLMNKKSFILSLLLGGIIGALLLALSHMVLGLGSDILLLQDSQPMHVRGYWVAIGFSIIVGFLGQFVHRLINLGGFFKLTSDEK